jgi:hypothetical protein
MLAAAVLLCGLACAGAAPAWAQRELPDAMALARHAYELAQAGQLDSAVAELEQSGPITATILGSVASLVAAVWPPSALHRLSSATN